MTIQGPMRVAFVGSPEYPGVRQKAAGTKKPLGFGQDIFPEIDGEEARTAKVWKRPAFLVSVGSTVVALAVAVVLLITQAAATKPPAAGDMTLASGNVNVTVSWSGPNVPYNLILVKADRSVSDLTYLIRGRQAFLPKASGLAPAGSCLIVRPASIPLSTAIGLDKDTLDKQGAAKACL